MKEKIKKYICMVTAVIAVIISIPVFAEGVSFSELKNMDYLSADEILWLEGLAHTYENKEYKWNRAESDMIESVIKIFNDNLIFKEQLFNEVPTENNENYKKIPKEYFCSIHTSDNIEYRLYWDSTDVFVTRVDINQKNISQGLFKYRNESLYTELKIILDEYAKETPKPVETEGFKLYNLQTLYSAEFTTTSHIFPEVKWGFYSYSLEQEAAPIIAAYFSYSSDMLLQTFSFSAKDNIITWDECNYFLMDNNGGIYYPEEPNEENSKITLEIEFDNKKNVQNIILKLTGTTNEINVVDMSTYKYSGKIPEAEQFIFDFPNDSITAVNDNNSQEKVETFIQSEDTPLQSNQNENIQPKTEDISDIQTTNNVDETKTLESKQTEEKNDSEISEELPFKNGSDTRIPHQNQSQKSEINVYINGILIEFDQPPIIKNNRVLVPMRAIFEALDARVEWSGLTQTVTAITESNTIEIKIGETEYILNGNIKNMDVPAQIVNGRTLLPLRVISEALNKKVEWNDTDENVVITDQN